MPVQERDYMRKPLQGTWNDDYGRRWPGRSEGQPARDNWPEPDPGVRSPHRAKWFGIGALVFAVVAIGFGAYDIVATGHDSPASAPVTTVAPSSVIPQTSYAQFYQQVDQWVAQQGVTGIDASLTGCAFPKAWTVGVTFNCYVYSSAGNHTGLGQMAITILTPRPNDSWDVNTSWAGY